MLAGCDDHAGRRSLSLQPRRGGMLIHGVQGGSNADSLDPNVMRSAADYARCASLYEMPWRPTASYSIEPWLIEFGESNRTLDEWTLRLRPGIEFHHGKTVSADDLIFSVRRLLDPTTGAIYAGLLAMIDLDATRKIDARTVRFKLRSGLVCFPESVSVALPIIPSDFNIKAPVGTGPFKLKNFQPGQESVLVRHDNYWRPNQPYADGIIHVNFNDETARINALLSGQLNMIDYVSFPLVRVLEQSPAIALIRSPTASFTPLNMRVDQRPYSDVRVRQALRLLVDRPAMVKGVYIGLGRIANDLYSPYDPLFNHELPQRPYDPDQARWLLKAAGYPDLGIELTTADLGSGVLTSTELYATQARAAGVDVRLNKLDTASFYGSQYKQWSFSPDLPPPYNYFVTAQQADGPTSTQNFSHFSDPEFSTLYFKAIAEPDFAARKEMAWRMQEIQYERGGSIIWGFQTAVDAMRGIGGAHPDASGFSLYRTGDLWLE